MAAMTSERRLKHLHLRVLEVEDAIGYYKTLQRYG